MDGLASCIFLKFLLIKLHGMTTTASIAKQDRHFDGLIQERRNSIASALELCLSCINPLNCQPINNVFVMHHNMWLPESSCVPALWCHVIAWELLCTCIVMSCDCLRALVYLHCDVMIRVSQSKHGAVVNLSKATCHVYWRTSWCSITTKRMLIQWERFTDSRHERFFLIDTSIYLWTSSLLNRPFTNNSSYDIIDINIHNTVKPLI